MGVLKIKRQHLAVIVASGGLVGGFSYLNRGSADATTSSAPWVARQAGQVVECSATTPGASSAYDVMRGTNVPPGEPQPLFHWMLGANSAWFAEHQTFVGAPCVPWGQMMVGKTAWALVAVFADHSCWGVSFNVTDGATEPNQSGWGQLDQSLCSDPTLIQPNGFNGGINSLRDCIHGRDNALVCQFTG